MDQWGMKMWTCHPYKLFEWRTWSEETWPILVAFLSIWEWVIFSHSESLTFATCIQSHIRIAYSLRNCLLTCIELRCLLHFLSLWFCEFLKHVYILFLIFVIWILNIFEILLWGGVKHLDIWVLLVPVLYNFVHEVVVDLGISESKVTSIHNENVVSLFSFNHPVDDLLQMIHLLLGIKVSLVFVIEFDVIIIVLVKTESFRPAIVSSFLREDNRENIFLWSEIRLIRSPYLKFFMGLL